MKLYSFIVLFLIFGLFGFSTLTADKVAYQQIVNLKKGTLLVRLHKNEAIIKKLKGFHKDKEAKKKAEEVRLLNLEQYNALAAGYKFSKVAFFFGKDSKSVKSKSFNNIFLDANLEIDTSITIDENQPIFILDVGDIYFEHMSGHQEGYVVLNDRFEQLEKPFPFFVRKRSGLTIVKRSELDMALVLDKNLNKFFEEAKSTGVQ